MATTPARVQPSASEMSMFGPKYVYADYVPIPTDLGVNTDGSIRQVVRNMGAFSGYTDVLMFGKASPITRDMMGEQAVRNINPLGNRYFIPTNATCPNGEDKFLYVDNVAKGDALGNNVARAG
jgi:hypothetical protein